MADNDSLTVRKLAEADLDEADRIMKVAFGTFIGLPDPSRFAADTKFVHTRWQASPESAFAAEADGRLAGSNFATRWGSFGFFGPLSIDPELWDRGYGTRLMEPVVEAFESWDVSHAGLFTFAQSAKHLGLYQKFGFRPRALTLVLKRDIGGELPSLDDWSAVSGLDEEQRSEALEGCRRLTDQLYPGLDVTSEIESIAAQSLGDTVLVEDSGIVGFAACHVGAGTEAGEGACYVKFGAVAPGPRAQEHFRRLLEACDDFARGAGATRLLAGVNAARSGAYETLLESGFRIALSGIAMHRPNEPAFSRPDAYVIDDWR